MLRTFARKLFYPIIGNSIYDRYTPKPFHLYVYSLPLMLIGTVTFIRDGWFWFGFISFALGAGLAVGIILAIVWDKAAEYWSNVDETLNTIMKIKDPELRDNVRETLGLSISPKKVTIVEKKDLGQGFIQTKIIDLPVSPAEMQVISDVVLSGNPFSENEIVVNRHIVSSPRFRKLQRYMEDEKRKWIKPNNKQHRNMGFSPTRKGLDILYEFASPSVREKLKEI